LGAVFTDWFLIYDVDKVLGYTDALTPSQTDRPEYKIPPATLFNSAGGIKN